MAPAIPHMTSFFLNALQTDNLGLMRKQRLFSRCQLGDQNLIIAFITIFRLRVRFNKHVIHSLGHCFALPTQPNASQRGLGVDDEFQGHCFRQNSSSG